MSDPKTFIFITLLVMSILAILVIVFFCIKGRKKSTAYLGASLSPNAKEEYSSLCPTILDETKNGSWNLFTNTTMYQGLSVVLVSSSGVPTPQGVITDPCIPGFSIYFSVSGSSQSMTLISTSFLINGSSVSPTNPVVLTLDAQNSFYRGSVGNSSVYLFSSECTTGTNILFPDSTLEGTTNNSESNSISINNSSAKIYYDSDCTIPYQSASMITFAGVETGFSWYLYSENLYLQAWGPVSMGFDMPINGRFKSLYTSTPPVGYSLQQVFSDNKSFELVASKSVILPPFTVYTYNDSTKVQGSFKVTLKSGTYIIEENEIPNYTLNLAALNIGNSTSFDGVAIENAVFLALGPAIPLPSSPLEDSSDDEFEDVPNPYPVNMTIPDNTTSSSLRNRVLQVEEGKDGDGVPIPAPPPSLTQSDLRNMLLRPGNTPDSFDWRVVGNGRIETKPRNQRKTGWCAALAAASVLGDVYSLKYSLMAPYPSSFGIVSMVCTRNAGGAAFYKDGSSFSGINNALLKYNTKLEKCWPFDDMLALIPRCIGYLGNYQLYSSGYPGCDSVVDSGLEFGSGGRLQWALEGLAKPANQKFDQADLDNIVLTMKLAIIKSGPLLGFINASLHFKTFWHALGLIEPHERENYVYIIGEYEYTPGIGHGIAIVGWGRTTDSRKIPYWIVRNSWGNTGDNGYCKIAMATVENQGPGALDLPYPRGYSVRSGFSMRAPVYSANIVKAAASGALPLAGNTRYESAGTQDYCQPTCSGSRTCQMYDGCKGNCCPVLDAASGSEATRWWVNNNPKLEFESKPMELSLTSTEPGNSTVINFTRTGTGGEDLPENGIYITKSPLPDLLPEGVVLSYNLITNSYYNLQGGDTTKAISLNIANSETSCVANR